MKASDPFIELAVRVSDGSYESSLRVPVNSTSEQRDGFAKMWVGMMAQAMALPSAQEASDEREQAALQEMRRGMRKEGE